MKITDRANQPKKAHTFIKDQLFANGLHKPLKKLLVKGPQSYNGLVKRFGEVKLLQMATQLNIHQVPAGDDYTWTLAEREKFSFKALRDS